jgi:cbb3-type cytochrome oxidase subunit 3
MTYETFRAFADTWWLVFLAAVFLILVVWVFRRGSAERYRRAAEIPLRDGDDPRDPPRNRGAKDAR